MKHLRICLLVSVLCVLSACAGMSKTGDYQAIELSQKKLLVLPSTSLHRQIQFLNKDVQAALLKQLHDQQHQAQAVSAEHYKAAQQLALEATGAIYEPSLKDYVPLHPQKYYVALLSALAKQYRFDTAIIPELVLRTAVVDDRTIEWDGQITKIQYPPAMKLARVRALSLKLSFFQANGLGLGQRYAGYLMPFRIIGERIPEFELRTDLYRQYDALHSAVALVLQRSARKVKAEDSDDEYE